MSGAGEGTLTKPRADIGFGDALDDFNPAEWAPEPRQRPRIAPEEGRRLAEATGFHSREAVPQPTLQPAPQPAPQAAQPLRRRRTGRNAQLNLKCRPDTIEAFYAIADGQGWGLGETLEHAVALLQRELPETTR